MTVRNPARRSKGFQPVVSGQAEKNDCSRQLPYPEATNTGWKPVLRQRMMIAHHDLDAASRQILMDNSLPSRSFPTTLWTVVLHAGRDEPARARVALQQLCQGYWYPLYSFVRHRGYGPHDAQDLTQAFFAHLLEKRGLGRADPERGRFRTFLLAALKNFLANEWDKSHARKRGGGQTIVSLEQEAGESRYRLEPAHDLTPERHFERQWAVTLLDQVLSALQNEYEAEGKSELFDEMKNVITGHAGAYAEMAARLKRSEGAIKVAAHRLRHRYRELIRARIAQTVGEGEVEDELRHLMAALRG